MTAIVARTDTAEQRSAVYARLNERNRLVRVLRIGLPVIGAIIFVGLVVQIFVGSLVPDLGFANVTIDRENLVVEAPVYSGIGTDGTAYAVSATSARTAFGNMNVIDLTDAMFTFTQPRDSTTFTGRSAKARLQVSQQAVAAEGVTTVESDGGFSGTIMEARLDIDAESMYSEGPVELDFVDGSKLRADTMTYDGTTRRWTFYNATVSLWGMPGEADLVLRPSAGLTGSEATAP